MPIGKRPRPSGAERTVTAATTTDLPPYERLTCPLSSAGQLAFQDRNHVHKLDKLKEYLARANDILTDSACEINDQLAVKRDRYEAIKKRQQEAASGERDDQVTAEADESFQKAQTEAEEVTRQLETQIRSIIDAGTRVASAQKVLREMDQNAVQSRPGTLAPTQSTLGASQFRDTGTQDAETSSQSMPTPTESFTTKLAVANTAYERESMTRRYASHNDYINFRKLVHDAQFPGENQPPLPHASTWFPDGSVGQGSQASFNTTGNATQTGPDSDDDFMVASERISIKCPITLVAMVDPVTSKKCPHSFEKAAIMQMIKASQRDRHSRYGPGTISCPVCDVAIGAADLAPDPVLVRKIRRIQAAEEAANRDDASEEDEDDELPSRTRTAQLAEDVGSSPAPRARMKEERMSQARRRDTSMVLATQV